MKRPRVVDYLRIARQGFLAPFDTANPFSEESHHFVAWAAGHFWAEEGNKTLSSFQFSPRRTSVCIDGKWFLWQIEGFSVIFTATNRPLIC